MTTQTGIRPDDKLSGFFGKCRTGQYRMLKVVIKAEKLVLESSAEAQGSWERDWDHMILPGLEESTPCFILFRLDEKEGDTYRWIMISWSPDSSSIRNKMLYASTKASLKREFGGGQIKDDLYGNVREDVSLEGYRKHLISAAAPGPLSREEIEREEVKQAQNDVAVAVDSKHNTMGGGIHFPMTNDVKMALGELKSRRLDYIQMSVDTKAEIINLEEKGSCSVEDLPKKVPENAPRYHLFLFKHTHEGDSLASVVFIYSMPGYNCSIKERMLYSSCKNGVVSNIEELGIEISKKIEVDSGEELTADFLQAELHPIKNLNRPKFAKPAPPNRGNRRITKQPV